LKSEAAKGKASGYYGSSPGARFAEMFHTIHRKLNCGCMQNSHFAQNTDSEGFADAASLHADRHSREFRSSGGNSIIDRLSVNQLDCVY
jgi:hypothetical protein